MSYFKIADFNQDEIYIHMLINSKCNFRCPYCVATEVDGFRDVLKVDNKYSELSKEDIDYILDNINIDNVRLIILGGEPLLSKNLNYIIEKANKKSNISYIEVLTNGSIPVSKVLVTDKLSFVFTYHPCVEKQKNIIKNINYCRKNNIYFEFNLMIAQDRYYPNISHIIKILKALNVKIVPIYPYCFQEKYNFNSYDYGVEDLMCFEYNGKRYSLKEIYDNELNMFKGWTCTNNAYIIGIDKQVRQCTGALLGDVKGFDFSKTKQKCPLEYCIYEGFIRSLKET